MASTAAGLEHVGVSAEGAEHAPYRMTAEEFFKAVEADVFSPERKVALWDGRLYEKMAKKLPDAVASSLALRAFFRLVPDDWCVWPENPILVNDFTAPLPDVAIVRGSPHDYTKRRSVPRWDEIGLVVELADATLKKNRTETLRTYAGAGLPVYWVVNLAGRQVEVYSHPVVEGEVACYEAAETFTPGRDVPLVLGGREVARIPVNDLLPEGEAR